MNGIQLQYIVSALSMFFLYELKQMYLAYHFISWWGVTIKQQMLVWNQEDTCMKPQDDSVYFMKITSKVFCGAIDYFATHPLKRNTTPDKMDIDETLGIYTLISGNWKKKLSNLLYFVKTNAV